MKHTFQYLRPHWRRLKQPMGIALLSSCRSSMRRCLRRKAAILAKGSASLLQLRAPCWLILLFLFLMKRRATLIHERKCISSKRWPSCCRAEQALLLPIGLARIREADQILFIDQGQIIERGTHEQLLAAKGRYYELYSSQFKRVSAQ